jgi:hypothetical protein
MKSVRRSSPRTNVSTGISVGFPFASSTSVRAVESYAQSPLIERLKLASACALTSPLAYARVAPEAKAWPRSKSGFGEIVGTTA